ncbi:MAG: RNA 3'-terminal phosphate cyclase [Pirellulales bacterium]|nr:RNA 3'-terminal phosphate cyclase [Pirellulales bacterium]
MLTIDGSHGEGGGQILRTSLALSLATGKPFQIEHIRRGRTPPGLKNVHVAAVHAARAVGAAEVEGVAVGSSRLVFVPHGVRPGEYAFSIGSAGSTTLVLQTILPPLLVAEGPSRISVTGGTHNPAAPPFDFFSRSYLPCVCRMGPQVTATLGSYGFAPAGGGRTAMQIIPAASLQGFELLERGPLRRAAARAFVSRLPLSIAQRELSAVAAALEWDEQQLHAEHVPSPGPGNVLMIELEFAAVTEIITAFGRRGTPAEQVAQEAIDEARRFLSATAPVGTHLADQLVLLLALAGQGRFSTLEPSSHLRTNIDVIRMFLDVPVAVEQLDEQTWEVSVCRQSAMAPASPG